MTKLEKDINKLAELGRELAQVGLVEYGAGWESLGDNISVYNSTSGSKHQAFQIDRFQINFFTPIKIEGEAQHLSQLPSYIQRVQAELSRIKSLVDERDETEQEALKASKIERLKEQLRELEA